MRWLILWALGAVICGPVAPARADDNGSPFGTPVPPRPVSPFGAPIAPRHPTSPDTDHAVREFSGWGTTTTGFFTVRDRWEVRWNAKAVVSVAVMSKDGAIVAGAAGVLRGSLFVPLGGQYYLKVSDGAAPPPDPTSATNSPSTDIDMDPTPPSLPPEVVVTWHLQIVQMGTSVVPGQALTVYTPYFSMPDAAVTPKLAPPPPPPPTLTDAQTHTIVSIKGDNATGAGFLMRSPDGFFVVAHLHLLAANPNVKLFTSSGEAITVLGVKGATDRDLAMFSIRDKHYAYLPASADPGLDLRAGDQLIIPAKDPSSDTLVGRVGKLVGMSPRQVAFDNAGGLDGVGAPVIHVKSGTVLGIVTTQKQVDVSDRLAQAWTANPAPGSSSTYYGLRVGGVPAWETYNLPRFLEETLFLRRFHDDTRYLDSYLNGRKAQGQFDAANQNGPPDNKYFLQNLKLREDQDTYRQQASDGVDQNQRLDAARELLFDLQNFAGTDLDKLQAMTGLYAYDQGWAREEIAYRVALRQELDDLGNSIDRLEAIAQSH